MTEKNSPLDRYEEDKRSKIMIGGYGGITIPLDEELKKAISNFIYQKVKDALANEDEIIRQLCLLILRSKDYIKNSLEPIVRDIIEDMDFTVRFDAE